MLPIRINRSFDEFNDIFKIVNETFDQISNKGLKKIIKRPHNLFTVLDDEGNIEKLVFECVYTPFKKDEISVSIQGDNLCITCGKDNITSTEKNIHMIYHGISYQSYQFSLPLLDTTDKENITVKVDDGMLTITIPVKKPEPKQTYYREIPIQ